MSDPKQITSDEILELAHLRAEVERLRGLLREVDYHNDGDLLHRIRAALAPTDQPKVYGFRNEREAEDRAYAADLAGEKP